MKTKVSKSEVMKEAWSLYRLLNRFNRKTRTYFKIIKSFSYCLKRAWQSVKLSASRPVVESVCYLTQEAYNEFYANTKYFGD